MRTRVCRLFWLVPFAALFLPFALSPAIGDNSSGSAGGVSAVPLKSPGDFASITNQAKRSAALFTEAGKVLTHPRCTNCHPNGDRPFQGNGNHVHEPPVQRGADGFGVVGMRCGTCHVAENFGAVPSSPGWHLAPRSMAWRGKSLAYICAQLKDPMRNGGRNLQAIVKHMTDDHLVGWAWSPGAGREPPPGSQKTFAALIAAWASTGAACPK